MLEDGGQLISTIFWGYNMYGQVFVKINIKNSGVAPPGKYRQPLKWDPSALF